MSAQTRECRKPRRSASTTRSTTYAPTYESSRPPPSSKRLHRDAVRVAYTRCWEGSTFALVPSSKVDALLEVAPTPDERLNVSNGVLLAWLSPALASGVLSLSEDEEAAPELLTLLKTAGIDEPGEVDLRQQAIASAIEAIGHKEGLLDPRRARHLLAFYVADPIPEPSLLEFRLCDVLVRAAGADHMRTAAMKAAVRLAKGAEVFQKASTAAWVRPAVVCACNCGRAIGSKNAISDAMVSTARSSGGRSPARHRNPSESCGSKNGCPISWHLPKKPAAARSPRTSTTATKGRSHGSGAFWANHACFNVTLQFLR